MFHLDRVSLVVAVAELQFVSDSVPQPAPPIVEDAKSADLHQTNMVNNPISF